MNRINRQYILPFLVAFSAFAMLISCNKDDDETIANTNSQTKINSPMLVFANEKELYATLDKIESFASIDELARYEKQMGYSSIGCMSDQFLDSIDFGSYNSIEDFYKDMMDHSNLVEVEKEPDSAVSYVPKFFHDRCRYVANRNGMYQVGDNVTRLFSTGRVTTNRANMASLLMMNDSNLSGLIGNPNFFYEPYPERIYVESNGKGNLNYGAKSNYWKPNFDVVYYNTNGDMRIYAEYCRDIRNHGDATISVCAYCKIKHRILGVTFWIHTPRHLVFEGKSEFHYRRYLGGDNSYSTTWYDSIDMINESRDSFTAYVPIFNYSYNAIPRGVFHNSLSPEWYQIVEFKRVTMAVHSASVTVYILDPIYSLDMDYALYLINKYH